MDRSHVIYFLTRPRWVKIRQFSCWTCRDSVMAQSERPLSLGCRARPWMSIYSQKPALSACTAHKRPFCHELCTHDNLTRAFRPLPKTGPTSRKDLSPVDCRPHPSCLRGELWTHTLPYEAALMLEFFVSFSLLDSALSCPKLPRSDCGALLCLRLSNINEVSFCHLSDI